MNVTPPQKEENVESERLREGTDQEHKLDSGCGGLYHKFNDEK
jgi:hypothetical protein